MAERSEVRGTGVSEGVAVGRVLALESTLEVRALEISEAEVERQLEKLRSAVDAVRRETIRLREQARREAGDEVAAVFDAHMLMLDDPELVGSAEQTVRRDHLSADWAVYTAAENAASALEGLGDEYLRARAADVRDVARRLIAVLQGREGVGERPSNGDARVLVGREVFPSQAAVLREDGVVGLVMEAGTRTSHAAILARSLGIPAVVGATGITDIARPGDLVLVDGETGTVVVDPEPDEVQAWRRRRERWLREREDERRSICAGPTTTADGCPVEVAANASSLEDVRAAAACGAEGIGLFRTELLFADRQEPPDEDEQVRVYSDAARLMAGRPVIVRTLDIGGDKPVPWMSCCREDNSFLGLRGIRLSLQEREVFATQVTAIARAQGTGQLWAMLPMVADVTEVRAAREIVEEACARAGVALPRLGIMVEVPSAALLADRLLREADFASIGTNDLTQYVMAADRGSPEVADLADPLHPAVLASVDRTARAAEELGKWVGVCGDAAGEPLAVPLLVGMGIRELSVVPSLVPRVRRLVGTIRRSEVRELAREALKCSTAVEVRRLVEDFMGQGRETGEGRRS